MKFNEILAYLIFAQINFRNLHWNTTGLDFFPCHEKMSEYYKSIDDYIDEIAEICVMKGEKTVTAMNFLEILGDSDIKAKPITSDVKSSKEVYTEAQHIWKNISEILYKVSKSGLSTGVVSKLDDLAYDAEKEATYKLALALK